ncbi:MAG: CBS domain-containing protein [Candidatus Dadabacteria bacterium]|nr:MAG: CBS domain-containing protein [Candidatus Dadabacteria bacterium]
MGNNNGNGNGHNRLTRILLVYRHRFLRWLSSHAPPLSVILLLTALAIGLATGVGAVIFRFLIYSVEQVMLDGEAGVVPAVRILLAPALGGILVGIITYYFAREAKGHGVPEVMQAVAMQGSRIRPRVALAKILASSFCIGSGGSVGREGPIVQIGATIGSALGQFLGVAEERMRNFVACGVAAGIAATFNAPIAAVFFAQEIILGEFAFFSFGSVIFAAVTGSVVSRVVYGDFPAFSVPPYQVASHWEYPLYVVLGILSAFVAVFYTKAVYLSEDLFESIRKIPEWLIPAIGGLLLGALALSYSYIPGLEYHGMPQVFGVGYDVIEATLHNRYFALAAVLLLVLKLAATSITLGSGGSGGVFAPGLFIGAMTGCAYGLLVNSLFPEITAPAGAYALVGMAAVFAGSSGAVITAIMMLFELTGDYQIILPLMLSVVVSNLASRYLLNGETIYTLKLARRGISLAHGRILSVLERIKVHQAMRHRIHCLPENLSLLDFKEELKRHQHRAFPVIDSEGKLFGLVTAYDFNQLNLSGLDLEKETIKKIVIKDPLVTYPDATLAEAWRIISVRSIHALPVVRRDDRHALLGMLHQNDIRRVYSIASQHKAWQEVTEQQEKLSVTIEDDISEESVFVEFRVAKNSVLKGRLIRDLATGLPEQSIFTSLRRSGRLVIPHGDTRIQEGDLIELLTTNEKLPEILSKLFGGGELKEVGVKS